MDNRITSTARCLCLSLWLIANPGVAAEKLTLGVHPYLSTTELQARFQPLADYLSATLNRTVTLRVAHNYVQHIDWVGQDAVDVAFIGPASYVRLVDRHGPRPLLGRLQVGGAAVFAGKIFVRADSPIHALAELPGHSFAFGDEHSTMSHVIPREMLARAGVPIDSLGIYRFLGSHVNAALAVLSGDYDAGAAKSEVFERYRTHGLRAIAETPSISEHLFVASRTLDLETRRALRRELFSLHESPRGRDVLAAIKSNVTGIVPVTDCDYDSLRELLNVAPRAGGLRDTDE